MTLTTQKLMEDIALKGLSRIGPLDEACCISVPTSHLYTYVTYSVLNRGVPNKILPPRSCPRVLDRVSMLKKKEDYEELGKHIPIPCHDFIVRTRLQDQCQYLLIERAYWPMNGNWWPVGGRRILPEISMPFEQEWSVWGEIAWKLHNDLNLSVKSIESISVISISDHYHLCFNDNSYSSIASRRATPVTTYLVDIKPCAMAFLTIPRKEASQIRWFRDNKLIYELATGRDRKFSDHLRVLFSAVMSIDFNLAPTQVAAAS